MSISEIRHSAQLPHHVTQQPRTGEAPSDRQGPAAPENSPAAAQEIITPDEKRYFEQLFPQAAGEIRSHEVYTPRGKRNLVQSGTHVDRKG